MISFISDDPISQARFLEVLTQDMDCVATNERYLDLHSARSELVDLRDKADGEARALLDVVVERVDAALVEYVARR